MAKYIFFYWFFIVFTLERGLKIDQFERKRYQKKRYLIGQIYLEIDTRF